MHAHTRAFIYPIHLSVDQGRAIFIHLADPSLFLLLLLQRGLDYYTGVIYEAILPNGNTGSIAAGGRYDNLVGKFSDKHIPCVGVSIGIERVLKEMELQEQKRAAEKAAAAAAAGKSGGRTGIGSGIAGSTPVDVLVASVGGKNLLSERMRIAKTLWKNDIPAEFLYEDAPSIKKQINHASENGVPLMIIVGDDEVESGEVILKDVGDRDAKDTKAPREESAMVAAVRAALAKAKGE